MKGQGGVFVDLGGGRSGFLRGQPPAPGRPLLVQVAGWAEPGKAPPVTARVLAQGTHRDPDARARRGRTSPAASRANAARRWPRWRRRRSAGAAADLGLIVRTAAAEADDAEVTAEIAALRDAWAALVAAGPPALLRPAPGAAAEALRDWREPGDAVRKAAGALADGGVWEEVAALRRPLVALGPASMAIEPTRALVAVDVNTGGDTSPAAALKANLAAAAELPRQLRLRGLGGQITIDFAPLAHAERPRVERALAAALRADGIETTIAGWTPLGHLELQRRRSRRPL